MIEIASSITLTIIACISDRFQFLEKSLILDASLFAMLSFVVFARLFKQLSVTRFIDTKQRSLYMTMVFIVYLIFSCFSTIYFCEVLKLSLPVKFQSTLYWLAYSLLLVLCIVNTFIESMYNFVYNFKYKLFFTVQEILNLVCIALNFVHKTIEVFWIIISLLLVIGILRLLSQRLKPYWLHKENFYSEFKAILQRNREKALVDPIEKQFEDSNFFRELRYLVEYAIFRPLEFLSLLKNMQKMLKKAGRSKEDTTEFLANFARIFVYNLMRRDKDFDVAASFIYERIISRIKPRNKKSSKRFQQNF